MKKIALFAMMLLTVAGLSSCGGYDEKRAEELTDKFQDGTDDLSNDEWVEAMEMLDNIAQDLQKQAEDALEKDNKDDREEAGEEIFESDEYLAYLKLCCMHDYAENHDKKKGDVKEPWNAAKKSIKAADKKLQKLIDKFDGCQKEASKAGKEYYQWKYKIKWAKESND